MKSFVCIHIFSLLFNHGRAATLRRSASLRQNSSRALAHLGTSFEGFSNLKCGVAPPVTGKDDVDAKCPHACPFFAEAQGTKDVCDFACVEVGTCMHHDPTSPVADTQLAICRTCLIDGCETCASNGMDHCRVCMPGYKLAEDGQCDKIVSTMWYAFFAVAAVVTALLVAWILELACRFESNASGRDHGLHVRSRAKIHAPPDESGQRKLYPLYSTNLCTTKVAGPAVLLNFNFQAAIIAWALTLAAVWMIMGLLIDHDLFILGTRAAETARAKCIVTRWGRETQLRLMWAKVLFLVFAYVFSFIGAVIFAVRQLRLYEHYIHECTHESYCAILSGVPPVLGARPVEQELSTAITKFSGLIPVGVSVGWDAGGLHDEFALAVEYRLMDLEMKRKESGTESHTPRDEYTLDDLARFARMQDGAWHKPLMWLERIFIHPTTQKIFTRGRRRDFPKRIIDRQTEWRKRMHDRSGHQYAKLRTSAPADAAEKCQRFSIASDLSPREEGAFKDEQWTDHPACRHKTEWERNRCLKCRGIDQGILKLELESLETSGLAFAIFQTEFSRNEFVEKVEKQGGFEYEGALLQAEKARVEPGSIQWQYLTSDHSIWTKVRTAMTGGVVVIVLLLLWICFFYMPYMYYHMSYVFQHGAEPTGVEVTMFTMLVVFGNVLMYALCAEVADRSGFQVAADRETCYLLLYNVACTLQVVLDLAFAYYLAYHMMVKAGVTSYDGTPLAELETFTERFKTYAMQRQLGEMLMAYAWPATFLLPFIVEPIFTIFVPYKVMSMIVASHPEIQGTSAERYLQSTPLDLSRYADVLLNATIAVMVFFFPGGYNIKMFVTMALSHVYIYWLDKWRVLKSVPAVTISSNKVDWWAQWLFGIPCAIMLSSLAWKSNCEDSFMAMMRRFWAPVAQRMDGINPFPHHLCEDGWELVQKTALLFVLHMTVHTLVLLYVVPRFGQRTLAPAETPYKDTAAKLPLSYFSANIVHCLRSEIIYEKHPPFDYCAYGKEHLIRRNDDIGAYFEQTHLNEEEQYGIRCQAANTAEELRHSIEELKAKYSIGSDASADAEADLWRTSSKTVIVDCAKRSSTPR